jgi:flavin reductase (DIM6/NTAB) family NADH-FMN oxidoreductase RutF
VFTVSYPRPSQLVLTSLAAAPRCEDGQKPSLSALPTIPAREVRGVVLADSALALECTLDRVVDGLGENSLLIGKVVAAAARPEAIRRDERDDNELIHEEPLLSYLHPGRLAVIDRSQGFPFPRGFSR